jgi:hypothetical protein
MFAAPEFFGLTPGSAPVLYVPIANRPSLARSYGNEHNTMFIDAHFYWAHMMGRLLPGVTRAAGKISNGTQPDIWGAWLMRRRFR